MSEFIELVAKAIWDNLPTRTLMPWANAPEREQCFVAARSVLLAMREPSDAMTLAGDNVYEEERDSIMGPAPVPMWRAMIDKALEAEQTVNVKYLLPNGLVDTSTRYRP